MVTRPIRRAGRRRTPASALLLPAVVVLLASAACVPAPPAAPPPDAPSIVFPVDGSASFTDTFGAPRSGGRTHAGQDLFGAKMTPVVAVRDGRVTAKVVSNLGLSGNYVTVTDDAGWKYLYIHLNNDTPGTDDGANRHDTAVAEGILVGARVKAGQLIGWLGDSGNAEGTPPHLHFEIRTPDNVSINPYAALRAAPRVRIGDAEAAALAPHAVVDGWTRNATTGRLEVRGWAVDRSVDSAARVTVTVDGTPVVSVLTSVSRPDVLAGFPGRSAKVGFTIGDLSVAPGARVCVVAGAVGGGGVTRTGCTAAP